VKRTGVLSLQIITSTCKGVPSSCIVFNRQHLTGYREQGTKPVKRTGVLSLQIMNFYMQRSPLLLHRFNKEEW